ncbi:MAG: GNAT family N-acetyltransferase [Euryarchaeota archaeon]|nr:GNAT family N-acetyltransferase [Euryarchaeota archaeon]
MKLADILSRADGHGLVSIRPMRPEDMEEVREVGQIAWSDMVMHDIGRKFRYPKRSPRMIEAYLAMEPEGCLVAEQGGKIIGSAFCHVWGKVGWIGPLEVLPDHQGSGVGKALLRACERHLEQRGCQVIGLETLSHIPKHLHLYLSSGYSPHSTVLIMEKMIDHEGAMTDEVEEVTVSSLPDVLPELVRLSALMEPSLNLSREAKTIVERHMGNVYINRRDGEVVGAAFLHTYQRGEEAAFSSIKAVLVDPRRADAASIYDSLLERCEGASLMMGKKRILIRFPVRDPVLYKHMLKRSYQLKGANIRMVKRGQYEERGTYHVASWAG